MLARHLIRYLSFSAFAFLISAGVARADNFTSSFNAGAGLTVDNALFATFFTLTTPSTVTFMTESYAGGANGLGSVPAGGFDPFASLYLNTTPNCDCATTGTLITTNDNGGAHVPADPTTGQHFDSYLQLNLDPGRYFIAITQHGNSPTGPNFPDFTYPSDVPVNFTASGDCPQFRDSTGACRTGQLAGEVIAVDFTSGGGGDGGGTGGDGGGGTPVPEPSSVALLAAGLLGLAVVRKR